jgi:hypothetical protein
MPAPDLCGAKAEFITLPNLAMAHRMVSGLESLPERIGREKRRQDILTAQCGECENILLRE